MEDRNNPLKSPIARRLIFYIILCSTLITFFTTAIQLYIDYKRDLTFIDRQLQQIEHVHVAPIAEALWTTDTISLKILLDGIIRIPDTQYVTVREDDKILVEAGTPESRNIIYKTFDLNHIHRGKNINIGQLEVTFSLSGIYHRLLNKFWVILATNGIKTFIVAGFMFFIFQFMVTRHLHQLAEDAKNIDKSTLAEPLALERHKPHSQEADEIDTLVNALNEMKQNIAANMQELEHHRDLLEIKVLERTAELETSNRELEAFSYSISHDLRAPLRAINGFSKIIKTEAAGQLDEESSDYLERIINASNRMGDLIDSMLRLSKISRREIHMTHADLATISRGIIKRFGDQLDLSTTEFHVADDLACDCDESLMTIALENLISNAIKYSMLRNPAIIEIGKTTRDNQNLFYIRDNGIGFDIKHAGKIFKPFHRLHNDTQYTGIGVGLATVQRVIERHNGTIRVESKPDRGATFYFTLFSEQFNKENVHR